jgi:uncharacterized protein
VPDIFWDTSALAKRYVAEEPGSTLVRAACDPSAGHLLLMSRLLPTEIASTLAGKVRTGELTVDDRDAGWQLFVAHMRRPYQLLTLTEAMWKSAESLLFRHSLKAADAIHLASALLVHANGVPDLQFWTADRQQAQAAQAEGLAVQLIG